MIKELDELLKSEIKQIKNEKSQDNDSIAFQKEYQIYVNRIKDKITEVIDSDITMINKTCTVEIYLSLQGDVLKVNTLSGDSSVCNAAYEAIYSLEKLPISPNKNIAEKMQLIILKYQPNFR